MLEQKKRSSYATYLIEISSNRTLEMMLFGEVLGLPSSAFVAAAIRQMPVFLVLDFARLLVYEINVTMQA